MNLQEAINFAIRQLRHDSRCPVSMHQRHTQEVMRLPPGSTGRKKWETQERAQARRARMAASMEAETPACACGYVEALSALHHEANKETR